jgi:uncharacterized repeat protein (TIGR01451 family)
LSAPRAFDRGARPLAAALPAMLAAALAPGAAVASGYGWTLSASSTDPFVHVDNPTLVTGTVYLWLACDAASEGVSSAEFGISCTNAGFSFTPSNGFSNGGTAAEPRLTIAGCPTGQRLAGTFSVPDLLGGGFGMCIVPSSGGLNVTRTCGARPLANDVVGFSSDGGVPCGIGAALCENTDLSVDVAVDDAAPIETFPFRYTITVTNEGAVAATGVAVVDSLRAPLVYESHGASRGTYDPPSGTWALGVLGSAETATLTLDVHAAPGSAGAIAWNVARRTAGAPFDPVLANDADSVSVAIAPIPHADLALALAAAPTLLCAADTVTFTVHVANQGPDSATSVEAATVLPAGLTYADHAADQGSWDSGTGVWSLGTLALLGEATLDLRATVDADAAGMALVGVAAITALDQADSVSANDADSAQVDVRPGATGAFADTTGTPGAPLPLRLLLLDDSEVTGVTLHHRNGDEPFFASRAMTRTSPGTWEATVPGNEVGAAGFQCWAEVETPCVTTRVPARAYRGVRVRVVEDSTFVLPAARFSLLAMPFQADDDSPLGLFDELAPYDTRVWRYGTWNGTTYGDGPGQAADAAPGQGFWIYSRDETAIAASGWSADLSDDVVVELRPGWNQIANPFAFPLDFAGLGRPPGVSDDLVGHEASGYVHFASTLLPRRGYWIRNTTSGPLDLVFPVAPPGAALAPAAGAPPPAAAEWAIEVTVVSAAARDAGNALGMAEDARDGMDARDYADAPAPPGDHLLASFRDSLGRALQADFRAPGRDGGVWMLELVSQGAAAPFRLELSVPRALPAGWTALLLDPTGFGAREVEDGAEVAGHTLGGSETARWRLVAGTAEYVQRVAAGLQAGLAPLSAPSLTIAPNPVSGTGTVLSLVLPRASASRLRLYDVRGRLVRELHAGALPAGLHRIGWDGTVGGGPVPAGVYFARLTTSSARVDRKIVVRGR